MNAGPALVFWVVIIATVMLSGLLLYLLPGLTRPDLYFAITVQPSFRETPEGREIRGRYQREIVIHTLIALAVTVASLRLKIFPGFAVGILWQVAGFFNAFLRARQKVIPHAVEPSTVREADLSPVETRLPGGWVMQCVPFAVLIAVAVWLRLQWDRIPERFPVHWGLNGEPNGWALRSLAGVYGPVVMGVAICGGLLLLNYGIAAFSRRIHAPGVAGELEQRFRFRMLSIMLGVEFFVAILFSWVGLFALRVERVMPNAAFVLLGDLGLVAVITVIVIRTGQGGTRLAGYADVTAGAAQASPIGDRTPDRYWKAGMFYVNPDDPALMVEKRFGVGYTFNFAHPLSWVILLLLAGVPLGLAILTIRLK